MYCKFFELSEKPFDITPDPKFLYLSPAHREVLSSLVYGIRERRGFIVVIGEAGTGKTTLLRSALDRLGEEVKVANIFNTDVTFEEMLQMVLVDLGLATEKEHLTKPEAIHRLNDLTLRQLAAGGNVVIMVDEAQNLDRRCLENLRLLSNLETRKNKLLQIILSGQPELEEKLRRQDLRQLAQRINLRRYVLPLDEKETYEYIEHRLKVVRYQGPPLFTTKAKKAIWETSLGIPRTINTLCDNALLIGFALKQRKIGEGPVKEAIEDLARDRFLNIYEAQPTAFPTPAGLPRPESPGRGSPRLGFTMLLVACLSLLAGAALGVLWVEWKEKHSPLSQYSRHDAVSGGQESPPMVSMAVIPKTYQNSPAEGAPLPPHAATPPTKAETEPASVHGEQTDPATREETEDMVGNAFSEPPLETRTVVTAKEGDTLFKVIEQHYGLYNKPIERKVLMANPAIKDPNWIYVHQRIHMPDLTRKVER